MNVPRLSGFGSVDSASDTSRSTKTDALLIAALEMDMSRVGIATAMAYRAVARRAEPLPIGRRA